MQVGGQPGINLLLRYGPAQRYGAGEDPAVENQKYQK
jgi:hypothetical protein